VKKKRANIHPTLEGDAMVRIVYSDQGARERGRRAPLARRGKLRSRESTGGKRDHAWNIAITTPLDRERLSALTIRGIAPNPWKLVKPGVRLAQIKKKKKKK